jgi:pyruvate-ferredoxin/flavodoxin oxidoreductase
VYDPESLRDAPATFQATAARWPEFKDLRYTLQVAPEDCTGCALCVAVCPVKNKTETRLKAINMRPQPPLREAESANWDFFLRLPNTDRQMLELDHVKDIQLLPPLFEFSGACAGCGETPYLKRNATGCSSIYGGNLPTTPWTVNCEGRGPAWSNSLFEDTAEFGLGMRLALDKQAEYARELLTRLGAAVGDHLVQGLLNADQTTEAGIREQRQRVLALKQHLQGFTTPEARDLLGLADSLVKKSVWIIGGDGWAYDIGYGGLDHVLASGHNVNVLVLDTEVYSNTGGQMSKSTPRAAVAKFATGGKTQSKKDLAAMAMTYGNVYVAHIAMGGNDTHTVKAFLEAESYDGPALLIAYSHCIAHGYDLVHGMEQQKAAVLCGHWPLFRYDPRLIRQGKTPFQLDSRPPSLPLQKYAYNETRYTMLAHSKPEVARQLLQEAQEDVARRWRLYEHWATLGNGARKEKQA